MSSLFHRGLTCQGRAAWREKREGNPWPEDIVRKPPFYQRLGGVGKSWPKSPRAPVVDRRGCEALWITPSIVRGILVSRSFHTSKDPILSIDTWETKLLVKVW